MLNRAEKKRLMAAAEAFEKLSFQYQDLLVTYGDVLSKVMMDGEPEEIAAHALNDFVDGLNHAVDVEVEDEDERDEILAELIDEED